MDNGKDQERFVVVKIGGRTFGGLAARALAGLFVLVILGGLAALEMTSGWPLTGSAALWLLFIGYWSALAAGAAPSVRSESAESRRVHTRLLNLALLLLFVPVPGLRVRLVPATVVVVTLGLAVQISSGLLGVWARWRLGRNWSGKVAVTEGQQLVRSGPYRILRHPIYTAMIGMSVGTAIVAGQLHAFIGVVIIAAAYWRKIRIEEETLRGVFGAEYDAYRKQSWALIPGVF